MSVVAYDGFIGAYTARQIRSSSYVSNVQIARDRAGGNSAADLITVMAAQPQFTFRTGDVGGAIVAMPTGRLWTPSGSIVLPFNKRAGGGIFSGTLSHYQLAATKALTVLRSITASQGDQTGASAEVLTQFLSSDGVTKPVTDALNQTLGATAYAAMYRMGPVLLGGVQLDTVTQVTVNTGLEIEVDGPFDGSSYPTQAFLAPDVDPTVTLTFRNFDHLAAFEAMFASFASLVCYFRKCADGGTTVSDATAAHVAVSSAGGLSVVDGADAEARQSGSANLTLHAKALTYSAASLVAA